MMYEAGQSDVHELFVQLCVLIGTACFEHVQHTDLRQRFDVQH